MTGGIISVNNKHQPQTLSLSVPLAQAIYLLNTSAPVSGDEQYSYSFPQLPPRPTMTLSWRYWSQRSHDLALWLVSVSNTLQELLGGISFIKVTISMCS